jgi:hypothetical protein
MTNFADFLIWLSVGGGGALASSWIWERVPWFQALEATMKQMVFFLSCVVLSIAAFLIQTYVPQEALNQLAPYFAIVASSFTAVFVGTSFHKSSKPSSELGDE